MINKRPDSELNKHPEICNKRESIIRLVTNLEEGENSAREDGWISADDIVTILELNRD